MFISGSLTVSGSSTFNNIGPFNQSAGPVSIISPSFGFTDNTPKIQFSGSVGFKSENFIVSGSTKLRGTVILGKDGGPSASVVQFINPASAGANTLYVTMEELPISDPTTTGRLWNDSGTLKISAG
jgi:hypothetical protein